MKSSYSAMGVIWLICMLVVSTDMRSLLSTSNVEFEDVVISPNGVSYQIVLLQPSSQWAQLKYWELGVEPAAIFHVKYWMAIPQGIESTMLPVRSISHVSVTDRKMYVHLCTISATEIPRNE